MHTGVARAQRQAREGTCKVSASNGSPVDIGRLNNFKKTEASR